MSWKPNIHKDCNVKLNFDIKHSAPSKAVSVMGHIAEVWRSSRYMDKTNVTRKTRGGCRTLKPIKCKATGCHCLEGMKALPTIAKFES